MDFKAFRAAAAESLAQATYDPKKLAALHTGAALLVSLILTVINYFLGNAIDGAGGLANLGNRAILSTIQSALSVLSMIVLPFWEIGFVYAALRMCRFRDAQPCDLPQGFRRFGVTARLFILEAGIITLVISACLQVSGILFSFTPFFEDMVEAMPDISQEAFLTESDLMAMLPAMIPMYVIFGLLLCGIGIPLFYRFRLAHFALMDGAIGARGALRISGALTRGNKWKLFKLDLHFWWYYLAQLLIAAVAYCDVLLPALGVTLPISQDALLYGCFGIHLGLRLLLAWQYGSLVQTTYAHCYDYLKQNPPVPPQPKPLPENVPWQQ